MLSRRFPAASLLAALISIPAFVSHAGTGPSRPEIGQLPQSVAADASAPVDSRITEDQRAAISQAQAMGRRLFVDDRAAWLASDVVETGGLRQKYAHIARGWQTLQTSDDLSAWDVIFVGWDGDKHVKFAAVTVDFADPQSRDPLNVEGNSYRLIEYETLPPLEPQVEALFSHRQEALKLDFLRCSPTLNATSHLIEKGADRFVVVDIMPSRQDEATHHLGGHHEFVFELDRREQPRHFSQTRSCVSGNSVKAEHKVAFLNVTHLNGDVPSLFHVFSSLDYGLPLTVLTVSNKLLWLIDGDNIHLIRRLEESDHAGK